MMACSIDYCVLEALDLVLVFYGVKPMPPMARCPPNMGSETELLVGGRVWKRKKGLGDEKDLGIKGLFSNGSQDVWGSGRSCS